MWWVVRIWLPREAVDAPTWDVSKARLGILAQWEVSLHMAGSWDWVIVKVLTFCYSQWKADAEQFLNTNVLVSSANPQCSFWGCALWCVSGRKHSSFVLETAVTDQVLCETQLSLRLGFNQVLVTKTSQGWSGSAGLEVDQQMQDEFGSLSALDKLQVLLQEGGTPRGGPRAS